MDPYLLARIGDVTIQRILPKQDTPKNESSGDQGQQTAQTSDSTSGEIDLSMKSWSNKDKEEDKGGGEGDSKQLRENHSDESEGEEGDVSDEMDEEDEQDVPLSLVITNRSKEVFNKGPTNVDEEKKEPDERMEDSSINFDETNMACGSNQPVSEESKPGHSKEYGDDNEDDMPLSRLIAESENMEAMSDVEGESDIDDAIGDKNVDDEGGDDADGEGEEDLDEPEEEDEPENLIKTEDQDQEEQESGDEDPDREMIVVKQEPYDDEGDEDSNIKRKMLETDEDGDDKDTKKPKKEPGEGSGPESESENSQSAIDKANAEKKLINLRKNIREVMDENQLDEATLAAQRQEMERLARVQEQQRIIREVNRQINLNRQNTKTQSRVISLLQGGGTSLLKASPSDASPSPKATSPNTVLVKLSSGSGPPQVVNKKVLEILRSTKSAANTSTSTKATALANKLLNKPHSLTPSVSIAPVKPGLTITKMGKGADDDKDVAATVRKVSGKAKQKGKDVVTISSSSSDEDDCILISEPSGGEEEEDEGDDPTNSGMHTNDLYNVPDDQGRVLINVGHPENEPDVFLAPQIARIIKPHQVGGVRFLFDNVVESLERFKTSTGFGCILAHSMGLGKTLQVVSFCDVFLRYTEGKTVLCIMPINTLQNWMAEFNMWLPVEPANSPFAAHGEVQPRTFPLFVLNDLQKTMVARAKVVTQWAKEGGVLLIGYELYRQLSLQKPRKRRGNPKRKVNPDDDIDDEKNKHLLEEMHSALVKPGPDLIICDEGHRIKNSHASVSQALKQIRSKRRVVLTGYPLQNNLLEYWCMVDFVRPNYLGTKTEFSNMFERPIQNGQCIDSTPQDIRLMRYRAHVLHSLLEGFVQRRSHSVLTHALPQKEEYVILVRMTTFQRKLYDTFMNEVVRTKAVPNPLKAFAVCCKIWNHPDVLYHFLKRRNMGSEAVDLDLEETAGALVPTPGHPVVPVAPVKRGRGRSPKGTNSPVKRERKVNPRKRGGEDGGKGPAVAAVMPNTTSSNQPAAEHSPGIGAPQDTTGPGQPRPGYPPYPGSQPGNPPYPGSGPGPGPNTHYNSQGYPGFNPAAPQQGDFHQSGAYGGFNNQQGFNNQNMYPGGFGGNYYNQQDPYWNSPFFNNDPNNPNMFPNYNEPDPSGSNYYNQDMMGSDGYRGYNSGMNMNRPGMSGMNPGQQGRMGHSMMGMNNMGGMNMNNSMGMPGNNINSNNMGVNQNSFGMNSMNPMGQGMNPQNQSGMNMGQSNMGMTPQSQGMGMNQMSGMGGMSSQGHSSMNIPPNQGGHMGMNNASSGLNMNLPGGGMGQVSQSMASSSHVHTTTSSQTQANQSSLESQQQAAIENIANNLMMSSQQNLQSGQGLLGGSDNQNNPQATQTRQHSLMGPQHDPQAGFSGGMSSNPQSLMGGAQNQHSQMGSMQPNPQTQGNPQNSPHSQNQPNMIPSSQSSHMMANMLSSPQSSQQTPVQHSSPNMLGLQGHDSQNMMTTNQHNQNVLGNQQNTPAIQNQQGYLGNQANSGSGMMGNMPSPMYRNQQPNQGMFGQQSSMPMMGGNQGMFNSTSQPVQQHMMGNPQNNLMNQQMNNQQSMLGTGLDQTNTQGMLNQPPLNSNHPGMMGGSQSQNMIGNQDPNMPSANMSSHQNMGHLSGNPQDTQSSAFTQNVYGNQPVSNPMGNLQNMLNSQNMINSQSGIQNMIPGKSQNELSNTQDPSQRPVMGMNQNVSSQQNLSGNQSGMMMNQQSDSLMGPNMAANQQHGVTNPSNPLIDHQNMFGMNTNQMNQSGYMGNQTMMGHGMGNQPNMMNNQSMGGQQGMGMMMNSSSGHGMYSGHMNQHDMMGGSPGMMGQMTNPPYNQNQMGNNMMGMYNNQSGMMNYPGMIPNQMNNLGMMGQQNMNNPSLLNQNQSFGNNMMRNPSPMMGMRNPQPVGGMNPDMNQGMMNSYSNSQNNFGMFGNNNMGPNFNANQNTVANKGAVGPFDNNPGSSSSTSTSVSSSRFMSGGEMQAGGSQPSHQPQGTFNSDFGNFGLNSDDSKIWDDLTKKCDEKAEEITKTEIDGNTATESEVKPEPEASSQDSKVKAEDVKPPNEDTKQKFDEEVGCEKKEGEDVKKEDTKSPKAEGAEDKNKEITADITATGAATAAIKSNREDAGIPYDWATELLKDYIPGCIEGSAKMALLFCILEEAMVLGDRVLVFSQSLFTLNLIEDFLQRNELPGRQERWARNWNYYRLDGSTSAMEREKLINEFNSNPNIHLFLVSTRAGSLGINLVGANRVVVLDASWNPCHDTQAVCRVYRYGQRKPCFVYRLVTDNCLEKKIYDRQINKQGMADRVVDECNPDAHLSIKEVTNLCWDNEEDTAAKDFSDMKDKYIDVVMQKMLEKYSKFLSKEPFQHESLLVDRKDKKLSQAEKRLAKRSYELEKQASANNTRPVYGYYPGNTSGVGRGNPLMKPMASVRPMQSELNNQLIRDATSGRPRQWIPAEVWQKQGMSAQEMTLPLDVVIPTNSPDRSSIVLKAGQKVMVLKSPKGIYMQLESGKIIAIRTAFKVGGKGEKKGAAGKGDGSETGVKKMIVQPTRQRAPASLLPLRNNSNISIIPRGGGTSGPRGSKPVVRLLGANRSGVHKQPVATAKPYFGEGSPVTVTVTKKRIGGNQQASTSTAQVEIRREPKQVTVTPIPPPSPKAAASTDKQPPRTSTESSASDSSDATQTQSNPATQASGSWDCSEGQPPIERKEDKVECSVEIKPVKTTHTPASSNDNVKTSADEESDKDDETALSERLDKKQTVLPESLVKESPSKRISIEERAKMEPSLQPVVTLKNYRHLAFQSNKTVNLSESTEKGKESCSGSKAAVNPLPFKTSSSLSISPVTSKSPSVSVEPASTKSSLSIQPVKLPSSTSVNLVKPHSTFSVTPPSEVEKNAEEVKEPSMSITKITEKSPSKPQPPPLTPDPSPTVSVTPSMAKPDIPPPQSALDTQTTPPSTFPSNEGQKPNLTIQPSTSVEKPFSSAIAPTPISSFNPAIDLSFRPDFQQSLPGVRPDFYPGFPRPPLGFPPGNFFSPRKDASGKDLPSLPQFPTFDPASYISPNPFSAAAAGSSFPRPTNPFPSPAAMQPPAFDSEFSRMYSAFHRPEPQQASQPPLPPTQFNPYAYNPFLMHAGFPLPGTTNPPSNPPNPPSQ